MAKTTLIQLVDDIDGGAADETVAFGVDGQSFEVDLNKKNARALRKALAPYVDHARSAPRRGTRGPGRRSSTAGSRTLFSQLDDNEKARFRSWADMPTARRIADSRVQEWRAAGKP